MLVKGIPGVVIISYTFFEANEIYTIIDIQSRKRLINTSGFFYHVTSYSHKLCVIYVISESGNSFVAGD